MPGLTERVDRIEAGIGIRAGGRWQVAGGRYNSKHETPNKEHYSLSLVSTYLKTRAHERDREKESPTILIT